MKKGKAIKVLLIWVFMPVLVLGWSLLCEGDFYVIPVGKRGFVPVKKTEATASYATGDDGDLRKGVTWPDPRFADNGDGTVKDNLTGLIWLKEAACTVFFSGDRAGQNSRDWDSALVAANSWVPGTAVLPTAPCPVIGVFPT